MGGLGGREERETLSKGFLLFPSPQPSETSFSLWLNGP